ncbi:MAG: permease-like cell division protein FtsX [Candidatus Saccharibacteria bacterium]|nr:permease-like cell division protein FtsX [Candidatus Saccharibacteria bacterium]
MSARAKNKTNHKALANKKQNRRRMLTFWRIIRYGTDSFMRNSWLSVAATAVMTITLLIIFTAVVTQNILDNTITDLQNKVDMSIYLKTETTDKVGNNIKAELEKLSSVKSVKYISAQDARSEIAKANSSNASVLAAITEATNKNPATIRVVVANIDNTSQLEKFVATDALVKKNLNPDYKPSFAGERSSAIKSIGRAVNFAQVVGLGAGLIFVIISALIIFNTIRMAIFNRREEIQMMKLIGADQSFIRGPFLVEAIIYGVIAAFISTGIGVWALLASSNTLSSYQISVHETIKLVTVYSPLLVLGMILIGAVIGIISSLLATRRYLKL